MTLPACGENVSDAIKRGRLRNEVWRQANCSALLADLSARACGRGNPSPMTYIYFFLLPFCNPAFSSHDNYTSSLRQSSPHSCAPLPPCFLSLHTTKLLSSASLFFPEIEDGILLISLRMGLR